MNAKRIFDIMAASAGLVLLSPVAFLSAAAIKFTSPGPAFFWQERIGRGFRSFYICKFRSMVVDAPEKGAAITAGDDNRIIAVGRFLRKTKIDEIPQLYNVLIGDMSFVGPRPEVPKYVEIFRDDYQEILKVRPGITDLASIQYRDEAAILGQSQNPEQEYVERILPEKIRLAKAYVRQTSLWFDVNVILRTLGALAADRLPGMKSK